MKLSINFKKLMLIGAFVSFVQASVIEELLLDPSLNSFAQNRPVCAYDGNNFFVVWSDARNDVADLYGALVFPGGRTINPGIFPISSAYSFQERPCLTYDGTNYLVAWDDGRLEQQQITSWMFLTLVTPTGTVLYPDGIPIWEPYLWSTLTVLGDAVYGGSFHLIVWHSIDDQRQPITVSGARISTANGVIQVIDPWPGFLIDNQGSGDPVCAYDGTNYLVVYRRTSGNYGIWGSRITQGAQILDHFQIDNNGCLPDVAFGGSNYLVVWQKNNSDIYGARVTPAGTVLDPNGFPIATLPGEQKNPKVSYNGSHWVVIWEDATSADIYGVYVSEDGSVGTIFPVSTTPGMQNLPAICHGSGDLILATYKGWHSQIENYRIWGKFIGEDVIWTDNANALAYNGNRHLARKPNTEELHLVYTNAGAVTYRYSNDGGVNWTLPVTLGNGEFPAISLDPYNNPCVTWTNGNILYFGRKDPINGWQTRQYTFGTYQPSHPAICINSFDELQPDSTHILVRLYNAPLAINSITELSFQTTTPQNYRTRIIERSSGANMIVLDFPSVTRDYNRTLHATWMHGDTVFYGTRQVGQTWQNWGPSFENQGIQSNHPFVETYGDSVFVVWQNQANGEVFRGSRYLLQNFFWHNLSETPLTPSTFPVNASGLVTTFMDKTFPSSEYDIFWKTYPGQPLHNLSNTPEIGSNYPHTSLRFIETQNPPVQYTVWQEGDAPYYNIKTTQRVIDLPNNFCGISTFQPAYFTTAPGFKTPSLHLVQRDSFVAHWNIPVDIGRQRVKYNFRLEPDYCYKLKMVAYHEGSGIWKMRVKIDSEEIGEIMFNPYEPETLLTVISPELYADSTINLVFERISGSFASVGPVYIYRYENGQRSSKSGPPGGPMVYGVHPSQDSAIIIYSNPFQNILKVDTRSLKNISIRAAIYDVSGRFIKKLYEGKVSNNSVIKWDCTDRNNRMVSPGVYFLTIEKIDSGDRLTNKVIMIR